MADMINGSCHRDIFIAPGDDLDVNGSISGNVTIAAGGELECNGSCTGNVAIGPGAGFSCNGSCHGNVVIGTGGSFQCNGSMHGDILNLGGSVDIAGSFHGREIRKPGKAVHPSYTPLSAERKRLCGVIRSRNGLALPSVVKSGYRCKMCGLEVVAETPPECCDACGSCDFSPIWK